MPTPQRKTLVQWTLNLAWPVCLCAALVLFTASEGSRAERFDSTREQIKEKVFEVAVGVNQQLSRLKAVEDVAAELETGDFSASAVERLLTDEMEKEGNLPISSMTVTYRPDEVPASFFTRGTSRGEGDRVVFFITVYRRNGGLVPYRGSYTSEQAADERLGDITAWYREPQEAWERSRAATGEAAGLDGESRSRGTWIDETSYSPVSDQWWSGGYGVPFGRRTTIDGTTAFELIGTVYADLALDDVNRLLRKEVQDAIEDLPLEAFHPFIYSDAGAILAHPDHGLFERRDRLRHVLGDLPDSSRDTDFETTKKDRDGVEYRQWDIERKNLSKFGDDVHFMLMNLPEADWWLGVALDERAISRRAGSDDAWRESRTLAIFFALGYLLSFTCVIVGVHRGQPWRLWLVSIVFSTLCWAGILTLWYQHSKAPTYMPEDHSVVMNEVTPHSVRERENHDRASASKPLVEHFLPTGVFVQAVDFTSANNITVTGQVWQRYGSGLKPPEDGEPEFVLPEAEEVTFELRESRSYGDEHVMRWFFHAVLRQEFDYSYYPLDRERVWIRLQHEVLDGGVLLVPDIESYATMAESQMPGVEEKDQFVLEGWSPTGSFFSYARKEYMTSFGAPALAARVDDGPDPLRSSLDLYFHIGMDRAIGNPLIANFIPILVVSLLLFGVLFTVSSRPVKNDLLGFEALAVLGFCAALFFVVIIAHASLRERLNVQRLIYIEWFYFVSYFAILGVGANAIWVALKPDSRLVTYGDNLVARLVFLPLYTLPLLVVTIWTFW